MEIARAIIGTGRPLGYAMSSCLYLMLTNLADARDSPADHIVLETLRLAPPAWLIVRPINHIDSGPDGIRRRDLGRVRQVAISPLLLQRDPERWPDPLTWQPNRWEGLGRNDPGLFAFGAGAERCFGRGLTYRVLRALVTRMQARLDDIRIARESAAKAGPLYAAADFTTASR